MIPGRTRLVLLVLVVSTQFVVLCTALVLQHHHDRGLKFPALLLAGVAASYRLPVGSDPGLTLVGAFNTASGTVTVTSGSVNLNVRTGSNFTSTQAQVRSVRFIRVRSGQVRY